jgi:hypothetical protein
MCWTNAGKILGWSVGGVKVIEFEYRNMRRFVDVMVATAIAWHVTSKRCKVAFLAAW